MVSLILSFCLSSRLSPDCLLGSCLCHHCSSTFVPVCSSWGRARELTRWRGGWTRGVRPSPESSSAPSVWRLWRPCWQLQQRETSLSRGRRPRTHRPGRGCSCSPTVHCIQCDSHQPLTENWTLVWRQRKMITYRAAGAARGYQWRPRGRRVRRGEDCRGSRPPTSRGSGRGRVWRRPDPDWAQHPPQVSPPPGWSCQTAPPPLTAGQSAKWGNRWPPQSWREVSWREHWVGRENSAERSR